MEAELPIAVSLSGYVFGQVDCTKKWLQNALEKKLRPNEPDSFPRISRTDLFDLVENQWMNPLVHLSASCSIESDDLKQFRLRSKALEISIVDTFDGISVGFLTNVPSRFLDGFPTTNNEGIEGARCSELAVSALSMLKSTNPILYSFCKEQLRTICFASVVGEIPRFSFSLQDFAFGIIFLDSAILSAFEAALLIIHESIHQYMWLSWCANSIQPFVNDVPVCSPYSRRMIGAQVAFQSILINLELLRFVRRSAPAFTLDGFSFVDCMHVFLKDPRRQLAAIEDILVQLNAMSIHSPYELRALRFLVQNIEHQYAVI